MSNGDNKGGLFFGEASKASSDLDVLGLFMIVIFVNHHGWETEEALWALSQLSSR